MIVQCIKEKTLFEVVSSRVKTLRPVVGLILTCNRERQAGREKRC